MGMQSNAILEKHRIKEFGGCPKQNQLLSDPRLHTAHKRSCWAQRSYVMSLECIYYSSIAQLSCGKLGMGQGGRAVELPGLLCHPPS